MIKAEAHHGVMYGVQGSPVDRGQAAQPIVILSHSSLGSLLVTWKEPHLRPPVTVIGAQNPNGLRSLARCEFPLNIADARPQSPFNYPRGVGFTRFVINFHDIEKVVDKHNY